MSMEVQTHPGKVLIARVLIVVIDSSVLVLVPAVGFFDFGIGSTLAWRSAYRKADIWQSSVTCSLVSGGPQ